MEPKWAFAQNFNTNFHRSAAEIVSRLDDLKRTPTTASDAIEVLAVNIRQLAKDLGEATGSLPSYDQRQCEIQLKSLEKAVEDLRGTSGAAHKFSFKRRIPKEKAVRASTPTLEVESTAMSIGNALTSLSHRYLTISDMSEEHLSGEVTLSDLTACVVNLLPRDSYKTGISAMYVKDITDCVLLLPHVSGSILLNNLSNCVLVAGCQQFRMHNSNTVDVYLHRMSNPVIENCSGIRFSGYPHSLSQGSDQDDYPVVKDFSHIRSTPSLNWCLLPDGEREQSWPLSLLEGQALLDELSRILPRAGKEQGTLRE